MEPIQWICKPYRYIRIFFIFTRFLLLTFSFSTWFFSILFAFVLFTLDVCSSQVCLDFSKPDNLPLLFAVILWSFHPLTLWQPNLKFVFREDLRNMKYDDTWLYLLNFLAFQGSLILILWLFWFSADGKRGGRVGDGFLDGRGIDEGYWVALTVFSRVITKVF